MLTRFFSQALRLSLSRPRLLAPLLVLAWLVAPPSQAAQVTYYHPDGLGSAVMESNEAGQVTYSREYRPYGEQVVGAAKDGPGFTGHVADVETGMTYMQQRYYDPQIGRFLSVDPVTANSSTGANFNRYWYANNNSYRFTDPDGRWPSQKGFYVHQRVTYLVIGNQLPKEERWTLARAHVLADSKQYQGFDSSHRHAMRSDNQTVDEARVKSNEFVREQFQKAWDAPSRVQALTEFGIALHALQDSTSPEHAGFQYWGKETEGLDAANHVMGELYNPGSGSNLYKITADAWSWFQSGQLPAGNLFRYGADNPVVPYPGF